MWYNQIWSTRDWYLANRGHIHRLLGWQWILKMDISPATQFKTILYTLFALRNTLELKGLQLLKCSLANRFWKWHMIWNTDYLMFTNPNYIKLIHWGRVTHICVSDLTIIGSDNGLSPGRRQAIIWTNAGILLIGPLGTNFSEIVIEILKFSFKKMRLKGSSAKWRPFCLGLNVLSAVNAGAI